MIVPLSIVTSEEQDCWRVMLARPEVKNALDARMRDELFEFFGAALAAGVDVELTGRGSDFCSGGDLNEFGQATDPAKAHHIRQTRSLGWMMHLLRDRTVVRVHGHCFGAGVELAAFAGRVECDPSARFCLPERKMGLIPGAGGTVAIPRRIGPMRTLEMFVTGRVVDAEEAFSIGLVDHVTERHW
jgi:enoyl-CoA hydratase/carnithine racemase